ncbi:MAG: TIGR02281 family clan AA aspartic protease [Caulobacteraceae bacterium]
MVGRDTDGGFYVTGQVNGQTVRFLADTGSSDIVLSPADAQRLGLDPASMQFSKSAETANGIGFGAPYKAASLAIGPIQLADVPMSVNKAAMSSSLLGHDRCTSRLAVGPRWPSRRVSGRTAWPSSARRCV